MTMTRPLAPPVPAHTEVPDPAPVWGRHRANLGRRIGRPTREALLGILVLVLMTGAVGAYFQQVADHLPATRYPVTAPSTQWLQTPEPAAVQWFRAEVELPAAADSAVLWVDARDMYRVWVNGRAVSTNRTAARQGALPTGDAVDVRSLLKAGRNVIAFQVSGLGAESAALWARLHADTSEGSVEVGTDSGQWRSTSDAALTGSRLGEQPDFINAGFVTDRWQNPVQITPVRLVHTDVPDALLAPPALTSLSVRGFDAVYTVTTTLSDSPSDSWLQVASTGALTVTVNGMLVAAEPAPGYQSPNSHRPAALHLIQLGKSLQAGANRLIFRVTGNDATAIAVGGLTLSADGAWRPLDTASGDSAIQAQGAPMAAAPLDAATAAATWPNGFTAVATAAVEDQGGSWPTPWSAAGLIWLIAVLMLLVVATVTGGSTALTLGRMSLCLGPAVAAIAAAIAYGRWITAEPGFAYSSGAASAVIVLLVVPAVGAIVMAVVMSRRPGNRLTRQPASTNDSVVIGREPTGRPAFRPSPRVMIVGIAVLAGLAQGWRIWRQPLWQDEVTSIVVARSIAQHGLPQLDSGLYYFKAELYHALLAVVMSISDNPSVLRLVALAWFVATILAFGLLLMPVLTERANLQIIATAVLVLVPPELAWARDVRMYQQMQFFAVVFLALFIRALRHGRTADIVASAIALLAMYLSHEESFVLLAALPVMAIASRQIVWKRRSTFAKAFLPVGVIIAVQYVVSHIHPPDFGDDLSNRPYVGWDPNQADFYYQQVFFSPIATTGSLAVLSTLALIAVVVGFRRRHRSTVLMAIALGATIVGISLVLTAKVDRYAFVTMPLLVALAVMGAAYLVGLLATCVTRLGAPEGRRGGDRRYRGTWLRAVVVVTVLVASGAAMATTAVSPRGFGLWAADLSGAPNPLSHPDFAPTVTYLREHQRPGDQVITLAPPVMARQYLGANPDQVIQTGRNKLLYLVLRDGQAVETILGVPVLLTGDQIRTFLEAHRRVWLVSDAGSYIQGVPPDVRREVTKDFRVVAQDAAATVSLWDAG